MMAEGYSDSVIEGFLCPICKGDFGTAEKLLSHFQEEHYEEQDLLKSFRELFGKAKKKILKQDDDIDNYYSNNQSSFSFSELEEQKLGCMRSHYDYFKKVRSARLQIFSIPVNQLLIRLDKLVDNLPRDPAKKKAHEQHVVPWLDGSTVSRCPSCTRSFYLARRQHHCRLCGAVLCDDCSSFLSFTSACKILEKPHLLNKDENKHSLTFRICQICHELLEIRQHQKDSSASKPIILQFYERYCDYQKQADNKVEMYLKMYDSLKEGETTYNINDAQALRINIIQIGEIMDNLSSKIAVLGTKDTENITQGKALTLQKAIRTAAIAYLKNKLLLIPSVPTEEEILKIRETKREEVFSRLQNEKLQESSFNSSQDNSPQRSGSVDLMNFDKGFTVGQGWVPCEQMLHVRSDDPLIQQINIIQNYIKEARKEHRYDEVASLEANLNELRQEYWRNLQQQEEKQHSEKSNNTMENTIKIDPV